MTLSSKYYGLKAAVFLSLIGLTVSSHQANAGLFSKKPQPVHINEVVKAVNNNGLDRLCSAGTVKSKLSKSDFRYRQKGSDNHDEYITAWILCSSVDGFQESKYGKTIQAKLGGSKLNDDAVPMAKKAVQKGRPAHNIFCKIDEENFPEDHVAREIIQYCHKLESAGKQSVKGKELKADAVLAPIEDMPKTHLKKVEIKKEVTAKAKMNNAKANAKKKMNTEDEDMQDDDMGGADADADADADASDD